MKNYPEPIVGAVVLNNNNEVLLILQKKWNNQYCIPGGHVELYETIDEAIKREVLEEVGLDVEIVELLGVQDNICSENFHKKGKHFIFLDYLCRAKNEKVKLDNLEAQDFIWIKPKDALNLNLHDGTRFNILKLLERL